MSVVLVGLLAGIVVLTSLLMPYLAVLQVKQQTAASADAAALAAADALSGLVVGAPCEIAADLASRGGTRLTGCRLDGAVATVRTATSAGLVEVSATATAGPPPDPG